MSTRLTLIRTLIARTVRIRPVHLILAALAIVVCFALAALAVNVGARFANTAPATTWPSTAASSGVMASVVMAGAVVPQAAREKPVRGEIRAVLLTLRPEGFEPKRITRPGGKPFVLVVNNRSQIIDGVFRLDRVGANRVHEGRMKQIKRNWTQLMDLETGIYRLSVADHPDWVCQITITER